MKRRQFVRTAVAGAALWPVWLREAFADGIACQTDGQGPKPSVTRSAGAVSEAFRRANHSGKPLLVIVIPRNDGMNKDRGDLWGELLNFGSDVQLAPLSKVEVACATLTDLTTVVPNHENGDPLFMVVATDKVPATVKSFDTLVPEYDDAFDRIGKFTWEDLERRENETSDRRIATLANLLRTALGAPSAEPGPDAALVRHTLKDQPPSGTHWAVSSGCGVHVEGVTNNIAFGCGMGHVPAKSRRFLYFFSQV